MVEDVGPLAERVVAGLKRSGFDAESAENAEIARAKLEEGSFDAMVLDLGLPGKDGLEFLREIRSDNMSLPVLLLTARISVSDKVVGLNAGADDYLTKPFATDELVARLHALLRRPTELIENSICIANLTLDTVSRTAEVDGLPASMSPKEICLLEHLARRKRSVVSKLFLEDNLFDSGSEDSSGALDVLVFRLRSKLKEVGAEVTIHTVRGVGYMLTESQPDASSGR